MPAFKPDTFHDRVADRNKARAAELELARGIVADFHSRADAERAAEEFNRVVRRREVPSEVRTVPLPEEVRSAAGVRLDKVLAKTGLAESVSDAQRKIKAGAVEINGQKCAEMVVPYAAGEWIIQAGKKWVRVTL